MNEGPARRVVFRADPFAWLPAAPARLQLAAYDADGKRVRQSHLTHRPWQEKSPALKLGDMLLYEISGP